MIELKNNLIKKQPTHTHKPIAREPHVYPHTFLCALIRRILEYKYIYVYMRTHKCLFVLFVSTFEIKIE